MIHHKKVDRTLNDSFNFRFYNRAKKSENQRSIQMIPEDIVLLAGLIFGRRVLMISIIGLSLYRAFL